jgi:hypothetical protein
MLRSAGDEVTDFNDGAVRLTEMQYAALGINELLGELFPTMAGSTYFGFAPTSTWIDLIAQQIFELTRNPAVLTQQSLTVSSDGTHGPFVVDDNFVIVSPLTGNRYYAITFGTLTTGAPNEITIIVQAEAPNDPVTGQFYADGPNTLIKLALPWRGVTATNAPPDFSGVTTNPSPALGLGVVTLSGTPPAIPAAYDVRIVGDGQVGAALFQWRTNGGPWSASTATAGTFAIGSFAVHFTNDPGGSDPSFRTGDLYSFTAPGSPITRSGVAAETDVALILRCYSRWVDLLAIPEDRHAVWAKAAEGTVKRVAVAVDPHYPGRLLVTIAGAPGTAALSGAVIAAVQLAIDQQEGVTDLSLVAAATNVTVTATNDVGGQVTVPAAKLADVQAAAQLAWTAYADSTDIGGTVRRAQLERILIDAGAIDVTKLLLNGNGNVVLGANQVAVAASLASLTWVGV